jgi:hypothetical protein
MQSITDLSILTIRGNSRLKLGWVMGTDSVRLNWLRCNHRFMCRKQDIFRIEWKTGGIHYDKIAGGV